MKSLLTARPSIVSTSLFVYAYRSTEEYSVELLLENNKRLLKLNLLKIKFLWRTQKEPVNIYAQSFTDTRVIVAFFLGNSKCFE